jgi:flagellar hook-associated protein 3 FlgL
MRISQSRIYSYTQTNSNNIGGQLEKYSKQLSSGRKIDQGYDDPTSFVKTLRLNEDLTKLEQYKENANSALAFTSYTDSALNSFTTGLEAFKNKVLGYANSIHSTTSKEALLNELSALKDELKGIANTKVDDKYLFSGTDFNTPPISDTDEYQGNDKSLKIQTDTHHIQTYSINGEDLFLGYDKDIQHKVGLNVPKLSQTALAEIPSREEYINPEHSIKDLTGTDEESYFYMTGTRPDGTSFKNKFTVSDPNNTKVSDLMKEIELKFDNQVTVEINKNGEIMLQDKTTGNQKMSFHMVGSTESVTDTQYLTDDVNQGEIFEFAKSDFKPVFGFSEEKTVVSSENAYFEKNGNTLTSNVAQFIGGDTKEYATVKTKLAEVSEANLEGKVLELKVTDVDGNDINAKIRFSRDRTEIFIENNTFTSTANADEFSYQQLIDVIGVATSGTYQTEGNYDDMVRASQDIVDVSLDHMGRVQIEDKTTALSQIELAIFDENVSKFAEDGVSEGTFMSFNSNNAIAYDEPTVDVFGAINDAIDAIERELTHPDGNAEGFSRNRGVQGALDNLTHIIDHSIKEHSRSGSQYQNIEYTLERNTVLSTHVDITRTQVVSTDVAEASMHFQQAQLAYQALLSTVSKVNSLSLVNYI